MTNLKKVTFKEVSHILSFVEADFFAKYENGGFVLFFTLSEVETSDFFVLISTISQTPKVFKSFDALVSELKKFNSNNITLTF